MQKSLFLIVLSLAVLVGCSKSTSSGAKSNDPVEQKLAQQAGSGATDCGRITTQAPDQLKKAGDCAVQASQAKHAFYVAYDMPGMTVGVAGNSDGKLFYASSQQAQPGQTGAPDIQSGPCEAELRVAQSGRVTCFAPGSFMGGTSHAGGGMQPGVANPHGGGMPMSMPSAGTPNPHAGGAAGMGTSHGSSTAQPPTQQK
jgi:hypothetical protein